MPRARVQISKNKFWDPTAANVSGQLSDTIHQIHYVSLKTSSASKPYQLFANKTCVQIQTYVALQC